jgi:hypothetical protein
MLTYLFNTISIYLLMYFNRKVLLFLWILFSVSVILYLLPTTGDDYIYYKGDYDSSYLNDIFPYLHSSYPLDAEPFYKFYTSFIKITTSLPFNGFLALNFIICSLLLFNILRHIFKIDSIIIFFLFSLLTIIPTIYYFSPRSSISFIFAVYAFIFYIKDKTKYGVLFSFITIGFHSQFIPILLILFIGNQYNKFILQRVNNKTKYILLFSFIIAFILILLLKFPLVLYGIMSGLISSLPSAGMIEGKLRYFEMDSGGIRLTSLLSIFIFPFLFFIAIKYKYFDKLFKNNLYLTYKNNFILFLGLSLLFSLIVNIIFWNFSHIASRISRFSDYISLLILVPTILLSVKNKYLFLPILLCSLSILVIFVYPTLYNFKLSIF